MRTAIITLCLMLLTGVIQAQNKQSVTHQKAKPQSIESQMKNYFMVFLTRGPNQNQDSVGLAKLQEGHMANIERLVKEGKLIMAGPFLDDGNLRGVFIFDVATKADVIKLVDTDPAIKAGRFAYEIHPWMGPKKLQTLLGNSLAPGK